MNLVRCSLRCLHQQDGYCTLQRLDQPIGESNACVFFLSRDESGQEIAQLPNRTDG